MTKIFRKCRHSSDGFNHGDIDVAFQLFSCGMVWDGNLVNKNSRNHLVHHGYAVRHQGMQALTGKGVVACLRSWRFWKSIIRRGWLWKRNPLVADQYAVKRAMT